MIFYISRECIIYLPKGHRFRRLAPAGTPLKSQSVYPLALSKVPITVLLPIYMGRNKRKKSNRKLYFIFTLECFIRKQKFVLFPKCD